MLSRITLCAAATLVCGSAALGQLQNPSFELPGTTTVFQGWQEFNNAVPDFGIFRTGAVSLKCFGNGSGPYNPSGALQGVPTTPGSQWQGKIWVMNSSSDPIMADNFAVLNLEWHDAANNTISYVTAPAADANTPTDVWREITVTGIAPAGTASAVLTPLHLQGPAQAAGAVFFDDASLLPTSSTGILNPSFESDFAGWIKFGNAYIDPAYAHTGTKSCKIFGNFDGNAYNAAGCFQDFAAAPGQHWVGTAFASTVAADHVGVGNFAVINIEWRDSANTLISYISQLAIDENSAPDVWNQYTVEGDAPPGTAIARVVLLHIQGPSFSGGAVWFDDVTFGQGTVNPPVCDPDVNQDGNADQGDVDYLVNVVAGGPNDTGIDPDFNQDGNVDQGDIDALINVVAGGNCP
ncbi:MAG: hypothetical protein WC718_12105 [Phycisphaerales bacterium]|jgi:hypothetical protein